MATERSTELKRLLDELVILPDPMSGEPGYVEPGQKAQLVFAQAVGNFLNGGPELLDDATEHLWAYYRSVVLEFTAAERTDYGIPELLATADIWEQVEFREPPSKQLGEPPLEPALSYISFEGEVSWEPEHGLQLVFEHGLRLCKVGPYDGHNTNAHAAGDLSVLDVVFLDRRSRPT